MISTPLNDPLILTVTLSCGVERAWQALSSPGDVTSWWTDGVRLEAKVGGSFTEPWVDGKGKPQMATGKVELVEANSRIDFSWREKFWRDGETTRVSIRLSGTDQLTRLELTHSGWDVFKDETGVFQRKGFASGWWSLLSSLSAHVSAHTMTNDIMEAIAVDVAPDQAFQAWIDGGILTKWLCSQAKIGARPGDAYELFWDPEKPDANNTKGCVILSSDPGKQLVFQWRGPDHLPVMGQPGSTIGKVTFLPKDTGTQVMLQHTGFGVSADWETARAWQRGAWESALAQLVVLLNN